MTKHENWGWLWNLYDLDCVDDQHSHGKSVGKYHMVNRVNWIGEHQSSPNSLILNCLFRVSQLRNPSTCSVEIGGFPQRVASLLVPCSSTAWWGQTFLLCTGACLACKKESQILSCLYWIVFLIHSFSFDENSVKI